MSDREALAAALEKLTVLPKTGSELDIIFAAARERLAQLPKQCPTCDGLGFDDPGHICPTCHGSGKVYPAELVERIARAIHPWEWSDLSPENQALVIPSAVRVLDALNGTP